MKRQIAPSILISFFLFGCMNSSIHITPTPNLDSSTNTPTTISQTAPTITIIPVTNTPTLGENPNEVTLELLKTNKGCELPCWWGITPGHTKSNMFLEFLRSFSTITIKKSATSPWIVYRVYSPVEKVYSEYGQIRILLAVQNDIVKEIEIEEFNEENYHLENFLQKNGKPEAVLVSSYSSDYGAGKDIVPLTVALYYPKKGILALYGSWANVTGNTINACFDTGPKLYLWSPDATEKYSIEYFLNWDKDSIPYRSIEGATKLSIESFFNTYSNIDGIPCLQTSKSLWPSQ